MEAAEGMNMDIRTLRRYESDETPLISPIFDQLIALYKVSVEVIHELVKSGAANQNIIQTINGDQTVVHQNQLQSETEKLEKRILELEAQNQQFIENDRFQENLIEQLIKKNG